MGRRRFRNLGVVSSLTLGGGDTGQVWRPTSREEAVATVKAAVDAGITFLDAAPTYGDGKAEEVIEVAFGGRLPDGVRMSTKCRLGTLPHGETLTHLRTTLNDSLTRMMLQRVDLFFLHNLIITDEDKELYQDTARSLFIDSVIPAFEKLKEEGRVGAWGVTGIGVPDAILETIESDPAPQAIQVIRNILDSPGGLKRFEGLPRPRGLPPPVTAVA